ncbi:hypothetical protein YC2023_013873 [Brassica napus]
MCRSYRLSAGEERRRGHATVVASEVIIYLTFSASKEKLGFVSSEATIENDEIIDGEIWKKKKIARRSGGGTTAERRSTTQKSLETELVQSKQRVEHGKLELNSQGNTSLLMRRSRVLSLIMLAKGTAGMVMTHHSTAKSKRRGFKIEKWRGWTNLFKQSPEDESGNGEDVPNTSSAVSYEPALPKSRWEEDVLVNNHTTVWGSYWVDHQWGYRCCLQTEKESFCTA